ncbi:MAG: hypothetical protein RSE50_01005 [Myroides sp.]
MSENIHWRSVYKSDFLASWDLDDRDELLTIDFAERKECKLARGNEIKVVLNFKEKTLSNGVELKPMICNPTNSKILSRFVKSGIISDWNGFSVLISVKENKGKIGNSEGLFIKDVSLLTFDIGAILNETDFKKAQALASENFQNIKGAHIEVVKNHLKKLKEDVG